MESPTLASLVFTRHRSHAYTHTTHIVHPAKSGECAAADLTHISSTVSHCEDAKDRVESVDSTENASQNGLIAVVDQTTPANEQAGHPITSFAGSHSPQGVPHHCVLTDMPKFLISCHPKVSLWCALNRREGSVKFLILLFSFCGLIDHSNTFEAMIVQSL